MPRCPDFSLATIDAVEWLIGVEASCDKVRFAIAAVRGEGIAVDQRTTGSLLFEYGARSRFLLSRRLGKAGLLPGIEFKAALLSAFHGEHP